VLPDSTMVAINFLEEKVLKEKVPKIKNIPATCREKFCGQ
jgi:hypothetical protein